MFSSRWSTKFPVLRLRQRRIFRYIVLCGQESYVFLKGIYYVEKFYKRVTNFVIGAKEKFQTPSGFSIDFVLIFAICLFDFSCF